MARVDQYQYRYMTFPVLWMLSLSSSLAAEKRPPAPTARIAIALQGGGFRAHCTDTGLLAGLLQFVSRQKQSSHPTFNSTGLLSRFDTFSSNSGSTWFFSQLAYSDQFEKLVESIASAPETAAEQFNTQWFDPFKKASHVDPSVFTPRRAIAEWLVGALLGQGDEDTIFTLQFILSTQSTWSEFVKIILTSTSSLATNMTLASPVRPWMQGKYWIVDHTVLLGTEHHRAFLFTKKYNASPDFYQTAYYFATGSGSEAAPLMVPAKFSIKLGDGANCSAPFPYVSRKAAPHFREFYYKGIAVPIIDEPHAISSHIDKTDFASEALVKNVGSLPIWGVATASSAFAGGAAVSGILPNEALSWFHHADMTPWVSRAPSGASFDAAADVIDVMKKPFGVDRLSIDALAYGAIHGVIDGGYSDGTGLGSAVAAGANEVFLVLNSAADAECNPFFLEILCSDGPRPANPLQPAELYPLFETPASTVRTAWSAFDGLQLFGKTNFLTKFVAGTIQLTTADNRYFGLKRNRNITVHIVHVCAKLDIGFLEKYTNFGFLVQEIAAAILSKDNEAFVNSTLLPMVMGQHANGETVGSVVI